MDFIETIEKNKASFEQYNAIKYQRFLQLIPAVNIKRALGAIPLLLCVNDRNLPGYVEGDVPLGISNYAPDDETKRFIRSKFPKAKIEPVRANPFVEMLAVMGSVGTVAYNKKSDFDYWVCVNRHYVSQEQFARFKQKVQGVQQWATREIGVPLHLFVNDVQSVKQNIFAEDEEEAFGSTVGAVLKDEFLRSSTIIAGKIPFWWVVPQFTRDSDYEDMYARLPEAKRDEFLDLGNLFEISREDFLGAALFQIIKSLGNPFKSIIKIGVLEKYIFGAADSPLLSQKIKINIHRGNLDNTIVDSYLLMFQEVFDYYDSVLEDKELINILKKNLYLKVDPQISRYVGIKDKKNIPYKVAVMFGYVKSWEWNLTTIRELDCFDEWDFNKVMAFWDSVKRFMLMSYQKIASYLPSLKLEKKISETDFMLLSRKIKTHFMREQDKIDNFITFKDTPSEAILYIEPLSQSTSESDWRLFKRMKSEEEKFTTTTLRIEKSLVRLLAWMSVNGIYDPVFTRLNIQSGYTRINQTLVTELLNQIARLFSSGLTHIKNTYFLSQGFALANIVIVNFNRENAEDLQTIHHLYITSWGESYLKEYTSEESLGWVLHRVLKDGLVLKRPLEEYCIINTPEPFKKQYKSIISLFKKGYESIIGSPQNVDARFIAQLGGRFVMVSREGTEINAQIFPSLSKLQTACSLRPRPSVRYACHADEDALSSMELAYTTFREGAISIVFEEKNGVMIVYVVDENGNVFTFTRDRAIKDETILVMFDFCRNAIRRVNKKILHEIREEQIRFYALKTDRGGRNTLSDETHNVETRYLAKYNSAMGLAVEVSMHMGDEHFYNVLFPDEVASGFMTMKEVYSVNEKVMSLRSKGMRTQFLIRDINFTDLTGNEARLGSAPYFLEKYMLELMLERPQQAQ